MNRKGQADLSAILITFIIVIVGLVLMVAAAQLIGDVTNTVDVVNESFSSTNGTALANLPLMQGKVAVIDEVYNLTGALLIGSGNWTILNNQIRNGVETAMLNVTATPGGGIQNGNWNVSYTYQPTTYIADGGGRALANIIVLFFALAILIVTLFPTLRNKVLEGFGR